MGKRELLVDTALALFYERGLNSVGINEVLKASGVAKKTLYHHFASKDDLVLAALKQRNAAFLSWFEQSMSGAPNDDVLVQQIFSALDDWINDRVSTLGAFRGCFFINTAIESEQHSPLIAECCHHHKAEVKSKVAQYLQHPSPQVVEAICLLKEGAIVSALVSRDKQAALKCIPIALACLRT